MTTRRLRVVTGLPACPGCGGPMTVYEPGQTTHPNCDPVYGIPPHGGCARNTEPDQPPAQARQLRLVEGA